MSVSYLEDILYKYYKLQNFTIQKYEQQGFVHQVFKVKVHRESSLANKSLVGISTNAVPTTTFVFKIYNTAINDLISIKRSIYTSLLFKKFITSLAIAPIQNAEEKHLTIAPNCTCALFPYVQHIHVSRIVHQYKLI